MCRNSRVARLFIYQSSIISQIVDFIYSMAMNVILDWVTVQSGRVCLVCTVLSATPPHCTSEG